MLELFRDGYFLMMSEEKWMDVVNINLMGLVNMSKAVLKIMKAKHIHGKLLISLRQVELLDKLDRLIIQQQKELLLR